jgi:hypothetical protein
VGLAHRRDVAETGQVDNYEFITYLHDFTQVTPVGDAHL